MIKGISHCALTYNGILLDTEIKDYMTINVEGRQLIAPNLNIKEVPGRNGDVPISQQYPARDIIVHFLISASRNYLFLEKIKKLTEILQSYDDVVFKFADEDGFRVGRLSSIDDPPYDSNVGMGKFIIHCGDPFLYRELKKSSGIIPRLQFRKYPVKIEAIKATLPATNKVVIRNVTRGTQIILNGIFNTNDELIIKKDSITVNGENKMMWLDFVESEYQHFEVYSEDEITITPNATFNIEFRERVL